MFFISCKAKKDIVAEVGASRVLSAEKIISNHYDINKNFKTLYIKADVKYKDNKQSQNITAEIKIQKDEKILVSIRFIGITMAKALITPSEVKYYEKLGGKFFEGNYATLSKWLGTDLDFKKVQNLLIGEALDDLKQGKYKATIEDEFYKLESDPKKSIEKTYYFEGSKFLIKKQEISQSSKNRMLQVIYPNHKEYNEIILPTQLLIEAFQDSQKTNISIEYNNAVFNEEITFPYSVPEGYEKININ